MQHNIIACEETHEGKISLISYIADIGNVGGFLRLMPPFLWGVPVKSFHRTLKPNKEGRLMII